MLTTLETVRNWFSKESLRFILGDPHYQVQKLALEVMAGGGKRWRPYLCAGVFESLCDVPATFEFKMVCASVECFHKASMIHDDIADDDKPQALHRRIGVAQALNVGDYLIHESYRLLTQCQMPHALVLKMIEISCFGQRHLCYGQGEELYSHVNEWASLKTAPGFEVAFRLGETWAGLALHAPIIHSNVSEFCERLGSAYQAKDDYEDGESSGTGRIVKQRAAFTASQWFDNPALVKFLGEYLELVFETQCPSLPTSRERSSVPAP